MFMAILKFEPNVPITVAFTYDTGKSVDGQYGEQFMRKTTTGDTAYMAPILEQQLVAMGYKKGQSVTLCKSVSGKRTTWSAEWPEQPKQQPLAGHRANAGHQRPTEPLAISAALIQCAKAAIDAVVAASEYAKSKGQPMVLGIDQVQSWTATLYIQHARDLNSNLTREAPKLDYEANDSEYAEPASGPKIP
jgi:hypothetical protein